MRTIVIGLGVLMVFAGNGTASFIEDSTNVCYQNDGQSSLDTRCDMPDTFAAIQALGADAPTCKTDIEAEDSETIGTLVPPHEMTDVPQEDPSDFCVANLYPTIPAGTRVTIQLANGDIGAGFDVSLHLWDPTTGAEITVPAPAAASTSSTDAAEEGEARISIHSGKIHKPFSPLSVSQVLVDGVSETSLGKSAQTVAVLDFVVKNEPHYMTSDGGQQVLKTGEAVRLCGYDGLLSYSVAELGGNIKFDGSVESFQVASGLEGLSECKIIEADVECAVDPATGRATQCSFTATPALPVLVFEARGHAIPTPKVGFASSPKHCHDICNAIGIDLLPSDWGLELFPSDSNPE